MSLLYKNPQNQSRAVWVFHQWLIVLPLLCIFWKESVNIFLPIQNMHFVISPHVAFYTCPSGLKLSTPCRDENSSGLRGSVTQRAYFKLLKAARCTPLVTQNFFLPRKLFPWTKHFSKTSLIVKWFYVGRWNQEGACHSRRCRSHSCNLGWRLVSRHTLYCTWGRV